LRRLSHFAKVANGYVGNRLQAKQREGTFSTARMMAASLRTGSSVFSQSFAGSSAGRFFVAIGGEKKIRTTQLFIEKN